MTAAQTAASSAATGPARTRVWPAALAATAGSVMVGFLPITTLRLYGEGMSTFSLLFWRYGIALIALVLAAGLAGLDLRGAARRGGLRIALVGATLGSAQTLCFFESLRWLETGIAVLLFYTYPAVTLALERILFKRPVPPVAARCVAMILGGAALIAVPGLQGGTIDPRGLVWALPGPLIYALYLTVNARLMRRHPPLVGAGYLYLGFTASFFAVVLIAGIEVPASAGGWLVLLFIALGTGALTITLFSYSVPRLGPSSYAIIANAELVTVVLVGVLLLGERLTPARAVGGGLVIAGILVHGVVRRSPPA
jgi:drug/metabolite transporter (DMT)-like permease